MKIALIGYGKMGSRIEAIAPDYGVEVSAIIRQSDNNNWQKDQLNGASVIIEFTNPNAAPIHINKAMELGMPIVIGTTGWLDDKNVYEELCQKSGGRVLYGSNFSIGVQLFIKLVEQAGRSFGNQELFRASVHEKHHTHKVDRPSGTALTIAKAWIEASGGRQKIVTKSEISHHSDYNDLPVTSDRTGDIIGEHALHISSLWDHIELKHEALSRDGFAIGAIKAAGWLVNQKTGFYLLEDVVENIVSGNF